MQYDYKLARTVWEPITERAEVKFGPTLLFSSFEYFLDFLLYIGIASTVRTAYELQLS